MYTVQDLLLDPDGLFVQRRQVLKIIKELLTKLFSACLLRDRQDCLESVKTHALDDFIFSMFVLNET